MSAKPTSSPQNTHWGKVSIALCAGLFVSMQVGKLGPAIPVLRDDLGLSLVDAGYALSIFTLLAIFLAVPLGAFSTFFGRRSIIVLGIISVMIGTLGSTAITQPWMFLVLRALEGFGFIAIAVNIPAFITHLAAPQDRTRALGVWSIYMPTGMAFALLVSTPFLTQIGWRGLWVVMFLLAIPLLIGLWWALEEPSAQQTREPRACRPDGCQQLSCAGAIDGWGLLWGLYLSMGDDYAMVAQFPE
jgi:MFS family permease